MLKPSKWLRGLLLTVLMTTGGISAPQTFSSTPLEGFVIDRKGRPAVGIEVWLTWLSATRNGKAKQLGRTKTDADGFFSFPHRPEARDGEWVSMVAFGQDGASASGGLPGAAGGLLLRLPPVSTVIVKVQDISGKALPERVLQFERSKLLTSNSEGEIRLTRNAGSQAYVSVPDENYDCFDSKEVNFPAEGQTVRQTIKLEPASNIVGRVLSRESGRPLKGVQVTAMILENGSPPRYSGLTDAQGRFEFKKVPPEDYNVQVTDKRYGTHIPPIADIKKLHVGSTLQVGDLKVSTPGRVRCRVRDKTTGKPLEGQLIYSSWDDRAGGFFLLAQTPRAGDCDSFLQPGGYDISVNDVSKSCTVYSGKTLDLIFDVTPESPWPKPKFTNDRRPSQIARVVDTQGKPVPFAIVDSTDSREDVMSDSHGFFDLDYFNPGMTIRVKKGSIATSGVFVTSPDQTAQVVFKLLRGVLGSVSGKVVDTAGKPIEGAVIDMVRDFGQLGQRITESVITSQDGSFSFSDLWPGGKYKVKVAAPGVSGFETDWFTPDQGAARNLGLISTAPPASPADAHPAGK